MPPFSTIFLKANSANVGDSVETIFKNYILAFIHRGEYVA